MTASAQVRDVETRERVQPHLGAAGMANEPRGRRERGRHCAIEQLGEEIFLTGEIVEQRGLAQPDRRGDLARARSPRSPWSRTAGAACSRMTSRVSSGRRRERGTRTPGSPHRGRRNFRFRLGLFDRSIDNRNMVANDPRGAAQSTATTYGARDHARAQAGTAVLGMPTLPAAEATDLPPGVPNRRHDLGRGARRRRVRRARPAARRPCFASPTSTVTRARTSRSTTPTCRASG